MHSAKAAEAQARKAARAKYRYTFDKQMNHKRRELRRTVRIPFFTLWALFSAM
jgi:hypothetical protein